MATTEYPLPKKDGTWEECEGWGWGGLKSVTSEQGCLQLCPLLMLRLTVPPPNPTCSLWEAGLHILFSKMEITMK